MTPLLLFYGGDRGETERYWFSDSNIVAKYFCSDDRGRFRKRRYHAAFLRMENPKILDWGYDAWSCHFNDRGKITDTEQEANIARERGHDGLIIKDVYEGEDENMLCNDYVVF